MSDARVDRPKLKETYGELWDRYVAQAFPKLQEDSGGELSKRCGTLSHGSLSCHAD